MNMLMSEHIPCVSRRSWIDATPKTWSGNEAIGELVTASLALPKMEPYRPLAVFTPATVGLSLPIPGAVAILANRSERSSSSDPLVEPGIEVVSFQAPEDLPAIVYFDDRDGTLRAPSLRQADEWMSEAENDERYGGDTFVEPSFGTKLGGAPTPRQGDEDLIALCRTCGTAHSFILQLSGNEGIDLGDGTLYVFCCPNGCELRSKFQR